jgi:hypothetical protein
VHVARSIVNRNAQKLMEASGVEGHGYSFGTRGSLGRFARKRERVANCK